VFDQTTNVLTINPTSAGVFTYNLYFSLSQYPAVTISNTQSLTVTVSTKSNSAPYFIVAPSSSYTIAPGKSLSLGFSLVDDDSD